MATARTETTRGPTYSTRAIWATPWHKGFLSMPLFALPLTVEVTRHMERPLNIIMATSMSLSARVQPQCDTSCKAHGVLDPSDWSPLTSTSDNMELPSAQSEEVPYNAHLSASLVPSTAQRMNEQDTIRQSVHSDSFSSGQQLLQCRGLPAVLLLSTSSTVRNTSPVPSPHCFRLVLLITILHRIRLTIQPVIMFHNLLSKELPSIYSGF